MVVDNGQKLSVALGELKGVPHRQVLHGSLASMKSESGGLVRASGRRRHARCDSFLIPFEDIHGLLLAMAPKMAFGSNILGSSSGLNLGPGHEDLRGDVTRCAGLMRLDLPPSLRKGPDRKHAARKVERGQMRSGLEVRFTGSLVKTD